MEMGESSSSIRVVGGKGGTLEEEGKEDLT